MRRIIDPVRRLGRVFKPILSHSFSKSSSSQKSRSWLSNGVDAIFSDTVRFSKIYVSLAIIISLSLYSLTAVKEDPLSFKPCLENPERWDGKTIEVASWFKAGEVKNDGFFLIEKDSRIWVKGVVANLRPDDFVTLSAIFHKEGYLEPLEIHVHKGRRLKIWVSILPLIIVLFLFFKNYRFSIKNFYFEER